MNCTVTQETGGSRHLLGPMDATPIRVEKYNDNAVSYRYFYVTITNESSLINNENYRAKIDNE